MTVASYRVPIEHRGGEWQVQVNISALSGFEPSTTTDCGREESHGLRKSTDRSLKPGPANLRSEAMMKSIFFSTLFVSVIAAACAINCYTCRGEGCEDPFDTTEVPTTCSGSSFLPNNYCRKTVVGTSVTRSCGTNDRNECTAGCTSSTSCTYCCESNHCNGGTTLTTSVVAMGVALAAAFIFSRR
ncbi:uncharacterized protein LOC105439901 [Strongylocentrotus purpuratus]|uniref:Uncharacterized protein n=1 Tax=Strongylocentrotus purpuratus TaxID=7668 RepID=A0A7M7P2U3_STRPU|nr:uncharacterized protein LOC105439901 [Strongylocentrotus purpuratus]